MKDTCKHNPGERINITDEELVEVVNLIKRTILNGTYGTDYTVIPREKFKRLKQDYVFNDNKIKEVLSELEVDNFIKCEWSKDERHRNDIVYIFKKIVILIPRLVEDAVPENVLLYIKITWAQAGRKMICISFHQDNI